MKHIIFDIEGNGLGEIHIDRKGNLHKECDRVHLLVLRSFPDGEVMVFRNNEQEDTIAEGWEILRRAEVVIGHNIIQYDLPVLSRLYGGGGAGGVYDTLVAARVLWPDAKNHPFGGNSLQAFGKHLKCMKGDYEGGWEEWNQEMEDYCVQDTLVSATIFGYVKPKADKFKTAVKLEHRVATICARMQASGVRIDVAEAEDLIDQLELERARCNDELQQAFPPRIETMKTPAYYMVPDSYVQYPKKKDAPANVRKLLVPGPPKTKEHPFNPGSSAQIADRLRQKYGWEAPVTDAGNASVGESVLKSLGYPEAELLLRAQMADKRLQHLTDWVRRARASRTPGVIHPQINHCGAATSRPTHQQPNQTACPKVLKPELRGYEGRYGWEMRSLWSPPTPGRVQVGGDASGLELRMLGHSLSMWDGGAYAREVVEGDIHTLNQQAGGLETRDQAKTVIYAYLYGAGDPHLDELIGRKGAGKDFRSKLERQIPALARLRAWCAQCASERGFIPLLDGRHAPIRSEHAALNTLLQGNGILVMKVAMALLDNYIEQKGWRDRCEWMLWPHDEFQLEADPDIAEALGSGIRIAIRQAGETLKLNCPLDGEYKIGNSWAETH